MNAFKATGINYRDGVYYAGKEFVINMDHVVSFEQDVIPTYGKIKQEGFTNQIYVLSMSDIRGHSIKVISNGTKFICFFNIYRLRSRGKYRQNYQRNSFLRY